MGSRFCSSFPSLLYCVTMLTNCIVMVSFSLVFVYCLDKVVKSMNGECVHSIYLMWQNPFFYSLIYLLNEYQCW